MKLPLARTSGLVGAVLATALFVAACGNATPAASTATSTSPTADAPTRSTDPKVTPNEPPADSVLPAVELKNVADGQNVDLAGLVPSKTPVLLWAWAPNCPICAGEAPGVESFAEAHTNQVTIVGIGTQDTFEGAEHFVSTYGVKTPQMLWDPGFASWSALKITGQPTWVLLSGQGDEIGRWQGAFPSQQVLAAT